MDVGTLVQIVLAAANIVLAVATLAIAFFTIKLAEATKGAAEASDQLAKATKRAAEASELNFKLMNFFEVYKTLQIKQGGDRDPLRKTLALMGNELMASFERFYSSENFEYLNRYAVAIRKLVQSESEDLSNDILRKYKLEG